MRRLLLAEGCQVFGGRRTPIFFVIISQVYYDKEQKIVTRVTFARQSPDNFTIPIGTTDSQ